MNNFFKKLFLETTFSGNLAQEHLYADRLMLQLIFIHWLIVATVTAYLFDAYLLGFFGGGALFTLAYFAHKFFKGTQTYRYSVALILMTFSIVMIQQSLGRIEMHFHIFGALSFLIIYKDHRTISIATLFIVVHHLLFNYFQAHHVSLFDTQIVVFNYGCGLDIVLLHAAFVTFEWFVLSVIVAKMDKTHKELHRTKDALESVNKNLESMVHIRTKELEHAKTEADIANKMKSEFLANMSHEIRTPMNAIIGFTDLLNKKITDPTEKNYVKSVQDSSKILLTLINDILDISKVEAGKLQIEYFPTDIRVIAEEINNIFYYKAKSKALRLSVTVDASVPNTLFIDEIRIRQILFNLISNSLKFTNEGHIDVTISSNNKATSVDLILIVHDTGIGMDDAQQTLMFDPFTQHTEQRAKEYGGTGLGLTIVKKLAQLMDGKILLKSKRNEGSTFILTFSDVKVSDEKVSLKENFKNIQFEKATILIADDIELNRTLIKEYLKDTPLEIYEAKDGQEAVDIAKTKEIDLILMDIKMPIKDGIEASHEIKSIKNIPIIAITASVFFAQENEAHKIFNDFLHKPLQSNDLLHAMCKFIQCQVQIAPLAHHEIEKNLQNISLQKYPKLEALLLQARNNGDIAVIQKFADELLVCAQTNALKSFKNISIQLSTAVDSFDIGECEILLSSFE